MDGFFYVICIGGGINDRNTVDLRIGFRKFYGIRYI